MYSLAELRAKYTAGTEIYVNGALFGVVENIEGSYVNIRETNGEDIDKPFLYKIPTPMARTENDLCMAT